MLEANDHLTRINILEGRCAMLESEIASLKNQILAKKMSTSTGDSVSGFDDLGQ